MTKYSFLPQFNQHQWTQTKTQLEQLINQHKETLATQLKQTKFTWENLLQPLEEQAQTLQEFWGMIEHLHSVCDNETIRQVYETCQPILTHYQTELGQHEGLYKAIQSIADDMTYFNTLHPAQQQIIRHHLRDFKLSGINLPQEQKKQFQSLILKLNELMTKFELNALDSRSAWQYHTEQEHDLVGLPDYILAAAKQRAATKNLTGWALSLDFPVYHAIMTYAQNRELREKFYRAYCTIASDQAENKSYDNTTIIDEILATRQQLAQLLGYKNYADYSLATKMAPDSSTIFTFLNDLAKRAKPQANQELKKLKEFAHELDGIKDLQPWDSAYYSEKLREKLFHLSAEQLRPYFPLQQVIDGLFTVAQKIFGIHIKSIQIEDVWHSTVTCYEITDAKNDTCGYFYMDLYARDNKRSGAWMSHYRNRHFQAGKLCLPIAFLNCNFQEPTEHHPTLLNHQEVETLFHEFGHTLHHLLTKVNYADVAGINGVEWDAVELPSQFLENWCWEHESLALFAKHYQTKAFLPSDLLQALLAAKNFQSALFLIRQLEFAIFDFRLHSEYDNQPQQVQKILDEVRAQVAVIQPPVFNRFQNSFGHIFAGGYAAGYYSYLWAEVLSCDAFGRFKEEGVFNPATGQSFLENILQKGGSENAMELFKKFRGREPVVDYLLQDKNIQ